MTLPALEDRKPQVSRVGRVKLQARFSTEFPDSLVQLNTTILDAQHLIEARLNQGQINAMI